MKTSMRTRSMSLILMAPQTSYADRAQRRRSSLLSFRGISAMTLREHCLFLQTFCKAPRTQLDAVSKINGRFSVSGLGFAEALPREYLGRGKPAPIWQWFRMHYGQTILLKRREEVRVIESDKSLNTHSSDVDRIDDANQ